MSVRTQTVCDNSGEVIADNAFRTHVTVTYGGGQIPSKTRDLDFKSAADCSAYVLAHDPEAVVTTATTSSGA